MLSRVVKASAVRTRCSTGRVVRSVWTSVATSGRGRCLHTAPQVIGGGHATGFRKWEFNLEWHSNKDKLLSAAKPGSVLVAAPYEYIKEPNGKVLQARKYAFFDSHRDYWNVVEDLHARSEPQCFHEVLTQESPRCLYFDVDGAEHLRVWHNDIVEYLRMYVRWSFSGDLLGWLDHYPKPVVLASSDPNKYSCHVMFPQIQFKDHAEQQKYMSILLDGLEALQLDGEGGESTPLLEQIVDRVPYTCFQLLRGPYACKFSNGHPNFDTQLQPDSLYQSDPLSCFAGYVDPSRAFVLPDTTELLKWNDELRDFVRRKRDTIRASKRGFLSRGPGDVPPMDQANLYLPKFQRKDGGTLSYIQLGDLEVYETSLKWLHPERAIQYWSWFRICGVTSTLLQKFAHNQESTRRIWEAHHKWSSTYQPYSEEENVRKVQAIAGKRASGLGFLRNLVRYDNPHVEVLECSASVRGSSSVGAAQTLEARIVRKSDIRFTKTVRDPYFCARLQLRATGDVGVSAYFFRASVPDLHELLEEGRWYTIKGGKVKPSQGEATAYRLIFNENFPAMIELIKSDSTRSEVESVLAQVSPLSS